MMVCGLNNALGAYSENYSDSAAGRCQKLQTVGRHQPVPLQMSTMRKNMGSVNFYWEFLWPEHREDTNFAKPCLEYAISIKYASIKLFFFCWWIFGRFLLASVPDRVPESFNECSIEHIMNLKVQILRTNTFVQISSVRGTRQCQLGGSWWSSF